VWFSVLGFEGSGTRKVVLQLLKDNEIDVADPVEIKLIGMSAVEAPRQHIDFLRCQVGEIKEDIS
jgi:hypothetical protein